MNASAQSSISIRRGSATVKIRAYDNHGSPHFLISWSALGRRKRESRATLAAAKTRAEEVATAICNGQIGGLQLTGADRDSYAHAVRALAPLKLPLHAAVDELVEARKLAGGASLIEIARDYAARHDDKIRPGMIPALVLECLAQKKADELKPRYLVQLRSDLNRFARDFHLPVVSITTTQIDQWLRALAVSPRTRDNLRTSVATFFSFCKRNGYLPKHLPTEAEGVVRIKIREQEVEVFTPVQLRKLLAAVTPDLIPFLTIGAFAGLRVSEIETLDWSAIRFAPKAECGIEVKSQFAKTGSRRIAPLPENLHAWLKPWRGEGPVVKRKELWRAATATAHELGLGWPQNVLRHSAISYRVALTGDVSRVSLESGNTPAIIFSHYHQLVTKAAAEQWFSILPPENRHEPGERKHGTRALKR